MAKSLKFGSKVQSIDLADDEQEESNDGWGVVIGWGIVDESNEEASNVLRETPVPLISNSKCSELYSNRRPITDRMLCAGNVDKGGRDACQVLIHKSFVLKSTLTVIL